MNGQVTREGKCSLIRKQSSASTKITIFWCYALYCHSNVPESGWLKQKICSVLEHRTWGIKVWTWMFTLKPLPCRRTSAYKCSFCCVCLYPKLFLKKDTSWIRAHLNYLCKSPILEILSEVVRVVCTKEHKK